MKSNVKAAVSPLLKLGVFMLCPYVKIVLTVLFASINLMSSFCNFIMHSNDNMASNNVNCVRTITWLQIM